MNHCNESLRDHRVDKGLTKTVIHTRHLCASVRHLTVFGAVWERFKTTKLG